MLVHILGQVEMLRGQSFLERVVPLLSQAIEADYTFIGQVDESQQRVQTLCLCAGAVTVENIQYALVDTPCQNVAANSLCVYPDGVCAAYPNDALLAQMGIEAYLGAPLLSSRGQVVGLLVALYKTPIINPAPIQTLFHVFAGRIAAEMLSHQSQQALERELESSRKLQEQYQILARQEREARHRAQKANRVKSTFVANMSHEVKTPMNAMLAFCQMLLKSELNQSQRLQVQSMLDAGQQLMTMLNDVLELSRLEDGTVELQENETPSHQLFDNVIEQAASQLQQKPVILHYCMRPEVPACLVLAEYHVQKVLVNLLSNAIKFTVKGEIHVDVSFELGTAQAGTLCLAVTDTGIGIAKDFLNDMFEPFTQQNASHARVYGGTGLGLHLAQRLIQTMSGTIEVSSELGQGSVFTVRIPVALPDRPSPKAAVQVGAVGVLNLHSEHLVATHCLAFLGAQVLQFTHSTPLALQCVQHPVVGLIIDATSNMAEAYELEQLLGEAAAENIPLAVVVSAVGLNSPSVARLLAGVPHVRAPVLMHEWLKLMDGFNAASTATTIVPAAPTTDERILLVEDNRLNQEIALCILEDAGYRVDIANNGQEAVERMESSPQAYRLVLMDIQMPVMDGLEATRIIRGQLHNNVPIVAVTAGIAVQDRRLCDEAGMDDFIPKPIDEDFVLQKVRYYMSGSYLP